MGIELHLALDPPISSAKRARGSTVRLGSNSETGILKLGSQEPTNSGIKPQVMETGAVPLPLMAASASEWNSTSMNAVHSMAPAAINGNAPWSSLQLAVEQSNSWLPGF